MIWSSVPILLILYGFFKDFKPGEPFLFKYQTNFLNLTEKQLNGEVYPYWTYSYLITLVPIFLSTDLLLYKPVLILESIGYLIFRLTSWTRASTMAGRTFGYLLSQIIVITGIGTYLTVNQISLISPILVFIFGLCFPRIHWKLLVERIKIATNMEKLNEPTTYTQYVKFRMRKLWSNTKQIYGIGFIRKWSLWWAMTTCMSLQVSAYSQTLWGEVQKEETTFNGFAEATYTACAAIAIMLMNMISIDWDKWGETALVLISSIDCALLLMFSQARTIPVMYICYICYRTLFQVMITIAQWNLAKKMVSESYGLIFGLNSFMALIMQALLTMIVVDKRGFGMAVRSQFFVYGTCHAIIALIFLCSIVYNLTIRLRHRFQIHSFTLNTINQEQLLEKLGQPTVANSNPVFLHSNNNNNNNSINNNNNTIIIIMIMIMIMIITIIISH
ncbi:Folate-like transporter 2 [Dirofilaria immitis]|nr:Folate-like transporter 2 [Dirofilaria immitis]